MNPLPLKTRQKWREGAGRNRCVRERGGGGGGGEKDGTRAHATAWYNPTSVAQLWCLYLHSQTHQWIVCAATYSTVWCQPWCQKLSTAYNTHSTQHTITHNTQDTAAMKHSHNIWNSSQTHSRSQKTQVRNTSPQKTSTNCFRFSSPADHIEHSNVSTTSALVFFFKKLLVVRENPKQKYGQTRNKRIVNKWCHPNTLYNIQIYMYIQHKQMMAPKYTIQYTDIHVHRA